MRFEVTEVGDKLSKVSLHGRLDASGAEAIETAFTASVAAGDSDVMIDLRDVTFLASLGIRLLLSVARVVQRRERKLVLFGAQGPVQEVLDTAALGPILPCVADEAAARSLLRP